MSSIFSNKILIIFTKITSTLMKLFAGLEEEGSSAVRQKGGGEGQAGRGGGTVDMLGR